LIPKPLADPLKALTLLAAALVCAGLANGLAQPGRRLEWTGWAPPAELQPVAPAPPPIPAPAKPAPPRTEPSPTQAPTTPTPAPALPAKPPKAAHLQPEPARPKADPQFAPSPQEVIRDLPSEAAWAAFQQRIPFLDARRSAEFEAGHVAGAWSAPIWEADVAGRITEFEAKANPAPQAPLVLYCSGGDCEDSRLLAKRLVGLGYRNLFIYRDGFPDWVRLGRPVASGARP
jgi:rhodanese-related sulfurtransferase